MAWPSQIRLPVGQAIVFNGMATRQIHLPGYQRSLVSRFLVVVSVCDSRVCFLLNLSAVKIKNELYVGHTLLIQDNVYVKHKYDQYKLQ